MIRTIFGISLLALSACAGEPDPVIGPGLTCPEESCFSRAPGFHDPAWSPDGSRIALVKAGAAESPPGLYLIRSDGTGLALLHPGSDLRWPTWTPAGDSLWVVSEGSLIRVSSTDGSVSGIDSRGSHNRPSANPVTGELLAHIDPRLLKADRDLLEESGLYRLPDRRRVSSGTHAAWTADGTAYWWVEPVPGRPAASRLIRSLSVTDARADTLAPFPDRPLTAPAPSPGHTTLLFIADRLYRYRFADRTVLPMSPGPAERATWSPDGSDIAYSDGTGAVWVTGAEGGARIRLTP
jgi:hypothetical protein